MDREGQAPELSSSLSRFDDSIPTGEGFPLSPVVFQAETDFRHG